MNPVPGSSYAPYKLYNIGNNQPVTLLEFLATLERHLGMKAIKNMLPMQPGEVPVTYADIGDLIQDVGFRPSTTLDAGIGRFVEWYQEYHQNSENFNGSLHAGSVSRS